MRRTSVQRVRRDGDEVAAHLSLKLDRAVLCGASAGRPQVRHGHCGAPLTPSPKEVCSLPRLVPASARAVRIHCSDGVSGGA